MTDENERLRQELAEARRQIDALRMTLASRENDVLRLELADARRELDALRPKTANPEIAKPELIGK